MSERRRQGLCYNCDEQYVLGHKCPRLFYLEVADFDEEAPADDNPSAEEQPPLISLHAITGVRAENTMKIRVSIGGREFTALLDSGSTHNFISDVAAPMAGLHFNSGGGATVVVANGDRVACRGLAHEVPIRIGQEDFAMDCYTIPLDCYDMVLGVAFPRTLGPVLWDFNDLCLAFWRQGRRVLWKGLDASRHDIAPTGHLHAIHHSEPELLEHLLQSFDDVFATPAGLPPPRACDHRIHLKPNTAPVAVRPYRYPQLQKDELEAQCATMLEQGIIRPSTSPFSAPVLLMALGVFAWTTAHSTR